LKRTISRKALLKYFYNRPSVTDKDFHAWVERHGGDVDATEKQVFNLAHRYAAFALGGVSKGKMPKGVPQKEKERGIAVEKEHTKYKDDAGKISADHHAETKEHRPDHKPKGYYPKLDEMEASLKKGASMKDVNNSVLKIAKVLTLADRRKLPPQSFAVSVRMANKEEPKSDQPAAGVKGKYPMPDKAHAISAVARVKQWGTPAEKRKVFLEAAKRFNVGPLANRG